MRSPTTRRRPASERGRARRGSRGFTLMEMLAVLAVISVLAAVATPGFVEMIRERRTQREAAMFSDTFRVARARALGRGSAVAVVVSAADPPTALIYEHVSDDTWALPLPSCRGAGTWRLVDRINGRPGASRLLVDVPDGTGGTDPADEVQVCYTPRGRTYFAFEGGGGERIDVNFEAPAEVTIEDEDDGATGFRILAGVVEISVLRGDGAAATALAAAQLKERARKVLVMQNGQTRVSL